MLIFQRGGLLANQLLNKARDKIEEGSRNNKVDPQKTLPKDVSQTRIFLANPTKNPRPTKFLEPLAFAST